MAAPVYVVNGSITCYGVLADWERVPKRTNSDGTVEYQPYARHIWDIPQMEMSTFLSLRAQQGKRLTSLATTDIDDRANGTTYTSVEMGLVNCRQTGRRAVGVTVEFRVRRVTVLSASFDNSDTGQDGEAATTGGPVVYGAGYSGQGRQVAEATTNLVYNYDLSGTYTGGLAQSCTLSNAGGTVTVSQNTDPAYIEIGASNQKAIFAGHNSDLLQFNRANLTNNTTYTWYLRFYLASGKVTVRAWKGSNADDTVYTTPGWHTYTHTATTTATGSTWTYLIYSTVANGGGTVYIDQAQIEQKAYHTPLAGGDMPGHSWTGTAHASTSTRPAATLSYTNPLSAAAGALALWWKPAASNSGPTAYFFDEGSIEAYFNAADDKIYLTDGTNTISTAALTFSAEAWQHLKFTWGPDGLKIYRNGAEAASGATYTAPSLGANLYIGSDTAGANQANGLIDELRAWTY